MGTDRHVTFRGYISTLCLLAGLLCYTAYRSALTPFISHSCKILLICASTGLGHLDVLIARQQTKTKPGASRA